MLPNDDDFKQSLLGSILFFYGVIKCEIKCDVICEPLALLLSQKPDVYRQKQL